MVMHRPIAIDAVDAATADDDYDDDNDNNVLHNRCMEEDKTNVVH